MSPKDPMNWLARGGRGAARQAPERPRLFIIGMGLPIIDSMTLEALEALKQCDTVFVHSYELGFFKKYCPDVRTVEDTSRSRGRGAQPLAAIVRRVLEGLSDGRRVGLVNYGHPMVYDSAFPLLEKACRAGAIPFRVISGISCFDAILTTLRLPIAPGDGVQIGDLTFFGRNDPNPLSHVLVLRCCQDKALFDRLIRKCLKVYPGAHRVASVICRVCDSIPERVEWAGLLDCGRLFKSFESNSTLLIPALAGASGRNAPRPRLGPR